jgi:polyferredoxin
LIREHGRYPIRGEKMPGPGPNTIQLVGIAYGIIFVIIGAFLWRSGRFSKAAKYALLIVTILLGFGIFSPMLPYMFGELVARADSRVGATLLGAVFGMALFFILTFLFGRHFCGYLCPIGAIQEIAYGVPAPKVRLPWKILPVIVRAVVFFLILGAGLGLSISVLQYFGIRQFFALTISTGFIVFSCLVVISIFFYRPFCRFICPLGAIFHIFATAARWKIRRTDACIECGKCEEACPTSEAGKEDTKGECYVCRRCMDACPVRGALVYGGKTRQDGTGR